MCYTYPVGGKTKTTNRIAPKIGIIQKDKTMTIRMWLRVKKYDAKVWLKAHTAHIIATLSTLALAGILVWLGSQELTKFIDKEFIAPTIQEQIVYHQKLN